MNNGQKDVLIAVLVALNISTLVTMHDAQGAQGIELVITNLGTHIVEFWLPVLAVLGGLAIVYHVGGSRV